MPDDPKPKTPVSNPPPKPPAPPPPPPNPQGDQRDESYSAPNWAEFDKRAESAGTKKPRDVLPATPKSKQDLLKVPVAFRVPDALTIPLSMKEKHAERTRPR